MTLLDLFEVLIKDKGWETISYLIFVRWMAFFTFYVRCYDFLPLYPKGIMMLDGSQRIVYESMIVLLRNCRFLAYPCDFISHVRLSSLYYNEHFVPKCIKCTLYQT